MSLFDQLRRSILGKNEQTPSKEADALAPKAPVQEEQGTERRRRRRINAKPGTRVLIVDDSPTIVAALKKVLNSAKYTTFEAYDAESGLQIAQAEQPELIFLDIVLPGMNGFAALRLMRRDPKTQHIPIIMISGNEQATEQFYANRIGADDFMKKPFSRFEVFARIERLLDANHVPRRKGATEEATAQRPAAPAAVAKPVVAQPTVASATTPPPSAAPVAPAVPAQAVRPAVPTPVTPTIVQSVTLQPPIAQATYSPQVVTVAATPVVHAPRISPVPAQTVTATPAVTSAATAQPVITQTATSPAPTSTAPPPVVAAAPTSPSPASPAPATPPSPLSSPLEARKELTAMGLQYFDQNQFIAAIKRGDKLAFELFVAGGAVDIAAETDGKTPLQVARENGRTQIFAILRSKLATMKTEESAS